MEIRQVDPRDQTSAIDVPVYRVYFWEPPRTAPGESSAGRLYSSYEYEITGCRNVREAIAWADENAGPHRSYTLYIAAPLDGLTLIRLFGIDPTKNPGDRKLLWPGEIYM